MHYLTLLLFFISLITGAQVDGKIRAAFDLGSAKFKLLVADVENGRIKELHSSYREVWVLKDLLAHEGTFSKKIEEVALKALKELKEEAEKYHAVEFRGFATAAFRNAKNGKEMLDHLEKESGINLEIISQKEEGELGFLTGLSLCQHPSEKLIVWDFGSGSFQFGIKHHCLEGALGGAILTELFKKHVRENENFPLEEGEVAKIESFIEEELRKTKGIEEFQKALKRKLQMDGKVIVIGYQDCSGGIVASHFKRAKITIQDVKHFLEIHRMHFTLNEFLRVAFLHVTMKVMGVNEVEWIPAGGSTSGYIAAENFWPTLIQKAV